MSSSKRRTRCVLLAPQRGGAPDRGEGLEALLEDRGWEAQEAGDPLPALAELCLLDRTLASRGAWGLHTAEQPALIVVDPARWPQLPALLSAARRYVPNAALLSYVDGQLHPLSPAASCPRRPGTPTGQEPAARAARPSVPDAAAPRISREEIDMLLERDDQEPLT